MILHANAALGRRQRLRLVSLVAGGVTIAAAAAIVGCSRQTGSKWVGRARRGERGILVRRTRFRRPQTNGKVERFIRTLLELWAHQRPYPHGRERTQALAPALDSYNRLRRHRALGGLTPLQRVNNLSGTNI